MPVKVRCPGCQKDFAAPDDWVGREATCPSCHTKMQVTANGANPPQPPVHAWPPGTQPPGGRTAGSPPSHAVPPPPPGAAANYPPSSQAPPQAASSPAAKQKAMQPPKGQPAASGTGRQVQRAKFITADPSASEVTLGADGQLPELHLADAGVATAKAKEEKQKQGNPLVLIGALIFSVGASVMMLLFDPVGFQSDSAAKAEARQEIEKYYTSQPPPLTPYLLKLREAQQAYSRNDYNTERRLYREVLDMLHAEGKNKHLGLTGMAEGIAPPNDKHLEQQLSILLGG